MSKDTGIAELESMCRAPYPGRGPRHGKEEHADLLAAYAGRIAGFAHVERPLTVAIDAANGMGGYTLPEILARLPEVRTHRLYFEPDGTFPNHEANPLKEENLRDVQALVRRERADLGVGLDGDADRCCFVDETGRTVAADLMTALFAPSFLTRFPGTPIVYDLRSSWVVREEVERAGGVPVRERVGHSFMKATMREKGSMFGGELSGHFYFGENFTTDSGELALVTAISLLSSRANEGRPLSQLVAGLRRYHATGELNFHVDDKDAVIAELKRRFAGGRQDELDGITVAFGDLGDREWWWFNVRASNTEPLLRLNLEASNPALMERRRDELVGMLGEPE